VKPSQRADTERRFVTGIRTDLKLAHSKIAEIQAEVVIAAVTSHLPQNAEVIAEWFYESQAQVCTKVASREQMEELIATATELNVPFATVSVGSEVAAIGVGPARMEIVNQVTGRFKLL
jgi:peptidyl-tRNA hydrolase